MFLASLDSIWALTTTGSGTTIQTTTLSPWVFQPTSALRMDTPAKLRVLFAPFSLILFYFYLSFKVATQAGLSQSTASTLGLVSMNVHIPWGSADGTRKGNTGRRCFYILNNLVRRWSCFVFIYWISYGKNETCYHSGIKVFCDGFCYNVLVLFFRVILILIPPTWW